MALPTEEEVREATTLEAFKEAKVACKGLAYRLVDELADGKITFKEFILDMAKIPLFAGVIVYGTPNYEEKKKEVNRL